MNQENKFSKLSDEDLKKEFETSKKLYYPILVFIILLFSWGVYTAAKGKMGFFLMAVFLFVGFTALKNIEKHSLIKKEIKSRNLS